MAETRCENEGCSRIAKWHPVIVWRDDDGNTLLEGDTHVAVCDDCKGVATVDAFMTDAQYRELCRTYATIGKPVPKRDLLEISLRPL